MNKYSNGFTIVEILMGIILTGAIVGGILGTFIVIQHYYVNGIAMADSEATARAVIEEIIRPEIREGRAFMITTIGNLLTVTSYDSSINNYLFNNGDGIDATFGDNTLQKNGTIIGSNIVKIPGQNIFEQVEENERIGINFGVRNEGTSGTFKEVHINTQIKLRN